MEQQLNDDASHYEISLTAGQAFVAFVLLLLSLAASFAFGIMVGRGQGPGAAASRQDAETAITEKRSTVVDVAEPVPAVEETIAPPTAQAAETEEPFVIEPAAPVVKPRESVPPAPTAAPVPSTEAVPHYAQLLSTADRRTAETLAARLIDDGFTTAYVERTQGEAGMIHRVRVRFPSEAEARAAVAKLQAYTSETIWVTRQQ
jgi:cell division septation protein DedD